MSCIPVTKVSNCCCKCQNEINFDQHTFFGHERKKHSVYVLDCGHLLCEECERGNSFEKCPLCGKDTSKPQEVYFEEKCLVCLYDKVKTILFPCHHACMCDECLRKEIKDGFGCPLCHCAVESYIEIEKA